MTQEEPPAPLFGPALSAAEVARMPEAVASYLGHFGSMAAAHLLQAPQAYVAHLGCRTGYPEEFVFDRIPGAMLWGIDPSEAAVAAAALSPRAGEGRAHYQAATTPAGLSQGSFTHALSVHPTCGREGRKALLGELFRVLMASGQALLSLPLRGSFPELHDMLREFALRHDLTALGEAVDQAATSRPSPETIADEVESAGFVDVDVDVELLVVPFESGRAAAESAAFGLLVFPELFAHVAADAATLARAREYVADAIAKYWSDSPFELVVNVGCVSARHP